MEAFSSAPPVNKKHRAEWISQHCATLSAALDDTSRQLRAHEDNNSRAAARLDECRSAVRRDLEQFAAQVVGVERRIDRVDAQCTSHQSVIGLVQSLESELKSAKAVLDRHEAKLQSDKAEKAKALEQSRRTASKSSSFPTTTASAAATTAAAPPPVPTGCISVSVEVPSLNGATVAIAIAPTSTLADLIDQANRELPSKLPAGDVKVVFFDKVLSELNTELRSVGITTSGAKVTLLPAGTDEVSHKLDTVAAKLKDLKRQLSTLPPGCDTVALEEEATKLLLLLDGVAVDDDRRAQRKALVTSLTTFQDSLLSRRAVSSAEATAAVPESGEDGGGAQPSEEATTGAADDTAGDTGDVDTEPNDDAAAEHDDNADEDAAQS